MRWHLKRNARQLQYWLAHLPKSMLGEVVWSSLAVAFFDLYVQCKARAILARQSREGRR